MSKKNLNAQMEKVLKKLSPEERNALRKIIKWERERMWAKYPQHKNDLAAIIEKEIK